MGETNWIGSKELDKLQKACKARGFYIGMDIDPKREAKDCGVNAPAADTILIVANDRPVMENIILSDTITDNLAVSALHLLEEVREYEPEDK